MDKNESAVGLTPIGSFIGLKTVKLAAVMGVLTILCFTSVVWVRMGRIIWAILGVRSEVAGKGTMVREGRN